MPGGSVLAKWSVHVTRSVVNLPTLRLRQGPINDIQHLRKHSRGTRLIAIEPNRHFHAVLRKRAGQRGIDLDLRGLAGRSTRLGHSLGRLRVFVAGSLFS